MDSKDKCKIWQKFAVGNEEKYHIYIQYQKLIIKKDKYYPSYIYLFKLKEHSVLQFKSMFNESMTYALRKNELKGYDLVFTGFPGSHNRAGPKLEIITSIEALLINRILRRYNG